MVDVSCLLLYPLYMENGVAGLPAEMFLTNGKWKVNSATVYQLKIYRLLFYMQGVGLFYSIDTELIDLLVIIHNFFFFS